MRHTTEIAVTITKDMVLFDGTNVSVPLQLPLRGTGVLIIEYDYEPLRPGFFSGAPEDCYDNEGQTVDIVSVIFSPGRPAFFVIEPNYALRRALESIILILEEDKTSCYPLR